jgi:hypothetical protein
LVITPGLLSCSNLLLPRLPRRFLCRLSAG